MSHTILTKRAELFVSADIAKTHLADIQAKLGRDKRVCIAAWA